MIREVAGCSGYSVTDTGKIISHLSWEDRELVPVDNGQGYLRVQLRGIGKKLVHRLVAEAFLPNPNGKEQVNHLDGNKSNNRVDNLEWATHQENMAHADRTGLRNVRGSNHGNSKLSEDDIRVIRELLSSGIRHAKIAVMFGVCRATISCVSRGTTWSHIS